MIHPMDMPPPKDWNQVCVLIEALRSDFNIVVEEVRGMRKDLTIVSNGLADVTARTTTLEDVVRIHINDNRRHN